MWVIKTLLDRTHVVLAVLFSTGRREAPEHNSTHQIVADHLFIVFSLRVCV